ncbi:hypothetical protein [Anaerosporobacter sp.]|uniref:hypothetical protein n=1 Tax=Anaerosporobacter sp. TaxID=1872529 RepID=UPI00286EB710|nr:hypothetical protein [Anaerosporobacter sp.]
MVLSNEQSKLFYDLWIPLLDYINQKYKLVKELYGMTSPKGLPIESVMKITTKLWEDVSVIDEYLNLHLDKMKKEQVTIMKGWKKVVHGKFVVERHLKSGSVLVSCDKEEVYIVCGIYSSWREMLDGFPMPQIVQTSLIPFDNVIIHDGIVQPDGICLGKNMADEARQIYLNAKEKDSLIKVILS